MPSPGTGTSPREPSDQWSASCQAVEEGVSGFTGVPDPDTRHNNGRLSPDWPRGSLSSLSRLPVIRRAPALGTRPGSLLSVRDRRDVPGRCAIRPAAARLGERTKLGHGGQLRGLREETPTPGWRWGEPGVLFSYGCRRALKELGTRRFGSPAGNPGLGPRLAGDWTIVQYRLLSRRQRARGRRSLLQGAAGWMWDRPSRRGTHSLWTMGAMCVQLVDVQCILQFTLRHAVCCGLHRPTSRVIHR